MAVVGITHWSDLAACRGASLSLFFDHDDETPTARQEREAKAKAICATCPVFRDCRADIDARPTKFGIFAGENGIERSNRRRRDRRMRRAS